MRALKGYHQQKIWDPVTRLWHWVLVMSVVIGWSFGKFMSFSTIEWHFYLGYTTGLLLLFRLCWGIVGPKPVRLTRLLPSATETIEYAKHLGNRSPSGSAGHNPLGSLSALAMILLLTIQAGSGLFVESDDFFESGPMAGFASDDLIDRMTWVHSLIADSIAIIVGLHVSAIVFYLLWKKENLITPMISGWKWVKQSDDTTLNNGHNAE